MDVPLHESTRRWLCRLTFGALCALPTLALLAWIAWRWLPGHEHAYAQQAADALGLHVEIERVSFPRPGETLLANVRLCDPETGRLLASTRLAELAATPEGPALLLSQPEIQPDALPRLLAAMEERWLRDPRAAAPLQLLAGELTLLDTQPQRWLTLTDVNLRCGEIEAGRHARLECRVAGMRHAAPLAITLERATRDAVPISTARLDTGGSDIACHLLARLWPPLAALGDDARLRGAAWFRRHDDHWDGEAALELLDVDLDPLLRGRMPFKLSGMAQVRRFEATLSGGRFTTLAGELHAGPGWIDRALVASAAEAWRLEAPDWFDDETTATWHYRQLALGFRLKGAGLTLTGLCDDAPAGTLLDDSRGPLLRLPDNNAADLPAVALLRALAPRHDVQVPATAELAPLLRWLPLPEASPPTHPPTARVRAAEPLHR